jgi:hypothetical protein
VWDIEVIGVEGMVGVEDVLSYFGGLYIILRGSQMLINTSSLIRHK